MYNLFVMSDFENPIDNSYIPIDIGLFYDNVQSSENQQDAGIAILTKEEEKGEFDNKKIIDQSLLELVDFVFLIPMALCVLVDFIM